MSNLQKIVVLCAVGGFILVGAFLLSRGEQTISGVIVDCGTNEPIANVQVELAVNQWWGRPEVHRVESDDFGLFEFVYRRGSLGNSANISATKDDYTEAHRFVKNPQDDATVRMLRGNLRGKITVDCEPLIHFPNP